MNKFLKATKGAVSVFLVIILVPFMLVSSVFVDVSRTKLSQGVVASSGDLALNTVLTQYDQDLNDYYGLLASCQTPEEVMAAAEGFFVQCMVSQGVETTDAKKFYEQLAKAWGEGSGDIADVLGISGNAVSVSKVENGSLANPALIKNQVVEFMKYRSPINAAADLLDALTEMKKKLELAPHEAELTNKKNKFYEAENKLLEKAWEVYKHLKAYNECGITKEYVETMKSKLAGYESNYRWFHHRLVFDLYNTGHLERFENKTINDSPGATLSFGEDGADTATINNLINNLNNSTNSLGTSGEALLNAVNLLPSGGTTSDSVNGGSVSYDIQYWRIAIEALGGSKGDKYIKYADDINAVYANMAELNNALNNAGKKVSDSTKTAAGSALAAAQSQIDSVKRTDGPQAAFDFIGGRLFAISEGAFSDRVDSGDVDGGVQMIHTEIQEYLTNMKKAEGHLKDAQKDLGKLDKLLDEYVETFEKWKAKADGMKGMDSEMAQTDREEVEEKERELLKNLNKESIAKLKARVDNIKSMLGSYRSSLEDKITYNGKPISEIKGFDELKQASKLDKDRIGLAVSVLQAYDEESFIFSQPGPEEMHNITDNNHPDLAGVASPELYQWMVERFKDYADGNPDNKEARDEYKDMKEEGKNQTDEAKDGEQNKSENIYGQENLPSGGSGGEDKSKEKSADIDKVSGFADGLLDNFGGKLQAMATNVRDDLYVTDYVMSMFSHDAYENEGRYDIALQKKKEVNLLNHQDVYSELNEEWKSEILYHTYNKTLTGKMINNTNNFAYGAEVEYILYGGPNAVNKVAAYGSVFMLRFVLNLPAVFKAYWKKDVVTVPAGLIEKVTSGIIPAPLAKLVICLGLTAAESAVDLAHLRAGIGVKTLKLKMADLFVAFDRTGDYGGKPKTDDGERRGDDRTGNDLLTHFQYSDYLTLFLFLSLSSSKANIIYARIADVVQVNMQKATSQPEFLMWNSQVYYRLEADIEVKPLMLSMPFAANAEGFSFDQGGWNTYHYSVIRGY